MFKTAEPFFIHVITPLHAGSGSDLGIVDLPIQRERHTGFPKIEGSGLKGSIREAFEEQSIIENKKHKLISSESIERLKSIFGDVIDKEWKIKVRENGKEIEKTKKDNEGNELIRFNEAISLSFGPENAGNDNFAGALGFTDARILLFPVKSMKGVFACITCPSVLKRFKKDLKLCNKNDINSLHLENIKIDSGNCIGSNRDFIGYKENVILEEYTFKIQGNDNKDIANYLSEKSGINEINDRLVILNDEDFKDFVNLSTEVITRTKIDNETGTVKPGALFTEEYLPAETIMYSLALASPIFNKEKGIFKQNGRSEEELVMDFFRNGIPKVMQIGGNATIGKGIVKIKI